MSMLEAETSEVEISEEEPEDPQVVMKRAQFAWKRTTLKLIYMVLLNTAKKVERHWEAKALQQDQQLVKTPVKAQSATQTQRRDDLTGVGEAVAPTDKKYPVDRTTCTHQDQAGKSALRAQGGQRRCQKTRRMVPTHLWVCLSCGSRWTRTNVEPKRDQNWPEKKKHHGSLRPEVMRTSEKRGLETDVTPMQVAIHSDNDPDRQDHKEYVNVEPLDPTADAPPLQA